MIIEYFNKHQINEGSKEITMQKIVKYKITFKCK